MRNLRWLLLLLTVNFSAVSLAQGTTATLRGPKAFDNPVQTRLGPLSATDTLWRLAEQVRPDPRLSVYQVMFALYEKNPDAFLDDNFNHLKPGAYLDVPTISEIRAVDPIAAQRKSENDDRLWAEKIRLAAQQPKVSNEQSAQREDLKNLQKELTDEFSRVEAEQDEALRDIRERMTASMSNVETIVQENTQLKKQLNTVVDELAAVQTQLGKDSEIQLQLQQLLAQQAEILAKQQEQIRKQEEGFNFAQAWQNLASSPAGWLIAGTLPALVLLYFIVMAIRRRGQKTEEMVAAATAAPLADPNYKSPLPPMDDSLDFDESSLINLDDSLLQAGAITASPLDGSPSKAKPAATINLDDDLLDDHFDLGSDLKLDHDLLDDTLLDDSSQPKPTAAPVEFDANNILSGDDLSSLLASVEAEAPAFEAKTDFDPNNILSGDDLSSLFANLEDDDDLTAPPPATASNEHLVPEHSAADMPEEIEIDLPDDLQQTVDDADIDALLNSHQSASPQASTDNTTNQQATSTTSTDSMASDDDFDIDSLLDSVQTTTPAQHNTPIATEAAAPADNDDIDIDALLSANTTDLDAANKADAAAFNASSLDATTPSSALMSAVDDIDAVLESAAGAAVSPAESILEHSVEGVIDSSELDAFAESLADDVLVPADLLVDEHSPEQADMDVEALLAAVDQQQFGQAVVSADTDINAMAAANLDSPTDIIIAPTQATDVDFASDVLNDALDSMQSDIPSHAREQHQLQESANAAIEGSASDPLAMDHNEPEKFIPEDLQPDDPLPEEFASEHLAMDNVAMDNCTPEISAVNELSLTSAELDSADLNKADARAPNAETSANQNVAITTSEMDAADIEMFDEALLDASEASEASEAIEIPEVSEPMDASEEPWFAAEHEFAELSADTHVPLGEEAHANMPALADVPVSAEAKVAAMADLQEAEFALDDLHQMLQGVDTTAELSAQQQDASSLQTESHPAGLATMHADHAEFAEFDSDFTTDNDTINANNTDPHDVTRSDSLANGHDFAADAAALTTTFDTLLGADLTLDSSAEFSLSASKAPDLQQGDDASVPVLTESQRSVEQPSLMLDEYPELEIADDWLTDDNALAALMDAEDGSTELGEATEVNELPDHSFDGANLAPFDTELNTKVTSPNSASWPIDAVADNADYLMRTELDETAALDVDPNASLVAAPFRANKSPLTVSDALAALDADSETAAELAAIDALNFDALLAELDDDFDPNATTKPLLLADDAPQMDVAAVENHAIPGKHAVPNLADETYAAIDIIDETDAKTEIPDYVHIDKLLAATDELLQAELTPDLDVDVGFADFDQLIEPHEVGDVDATDSGFASKLDLVRAYIEIGDADNAAALVREIGQSDAPDSVKAEAKKLLS